MVDVENRLKTGDHRGQPGRHRQMNRNRDAAEIKPVHQCARDNAVNDAHPVRERRAHKDGDDRQDRDNAQHAQREEGHRLGMIEPRLGADEAGAPQDHKNEGRDPRREMS